MIRTIFMMKRLRQMTNACLHIRNMKSNKRHIFLHQVPMNKYHFTTFYDKSFQANTQFSQKTLSAKEILVNTTQGRIQWNKLTSYKQKKQLVQSFYNSLAGEFRQQIAQILHKTIGYSIQQARKQIDLGLKIMQGQLANQYPQKYILEQLNETLPKDSGYYELKPYGNILVVFDHRIVFLSAIKYWAISMLSGNALILNPTNQLCEPVIGALVHKWETGQKTKDYAKMVSVLRNGHVSAGSISQQVQKVLESIQLGFISFNGRTEHGQKLYHRIASKNQCFAESQFLLNGNDACYIMDDLLDKTEKLKKVAKIVVQGAFSQSGLLPNSIKRIVCSKSMQQKFIPILLNQLESIKDKKQRPLLKEESKQLTQALGIISENVDEFKILTGGKQIKTVDSSESSSLSQFFFYEPTVIMLLQNYPKSISMNSSSIPGPIVTIAQVQNINQAIQTVNQSSYGIGVSIFTEDPSVLQNLQSVIGSKLEVGTVNVNTWGMRHDVPIPIRKRSGKGFSSSTLAYQNITRTKTITFC